MRYVGQEYTINVPMQAGSAISAVAQEFHRLHQRRFGHSTESAPVEFVNLRLAAFGELDKYPDLNELRQVQDPELQLVMRKAIFDGESYETPVIPRAELALDSHFAGPMIIEEQSATTIAPPRWFISLDEAGNVLVTRSAQQ